MEDAMRGQMGKIAVAILVAGAAFGQAVGPPPQTIQVPPPPPQVDPNDFKVTSDVELVLLDVSVKNKDGGFVSGIKKDAFKVMENKVDQPITVFAAHDAPVTVGLIVDNSGSVRPKKPEIVTAALTFVTQSNPADEMFVVNFNDQVMMGLPPELDFTADRNVLRQAMLTNPAQGRTSLYDAIKTGLQHLEKGKLDKKSLVIVSDGGDNASVTTKQEILRMIEETIVTIYTVGIFDPNDKDKNPGFLRQIAAISGGEAFIPENMSNLVGICEKIARDIRNRYTVGFVPQHYQMDGKARKIKLTAVGDAGSRYEVRTRTHYYPMSRTSALRESGR
ncbi:MAG: VWA domain-containing protein [Bryobacteraceae bacterium]